MTGINMSDTLLNKPQTPLAKTACGGKLKDTAGYPGAMYRGEQVYFCTHACLHAFEQNPDAFMEGEIDHPIDEE
jgi:YHS domain-containing protein